MDLSNRIVQVKSTLEPDVEEYPTCTPDDIGLLFGDIASPTGLILNKGDPRESFVIFPDSGYIPGGGYQYASHPRQAQEGDNLYCFQTIRGSSS